MPSVSRSLLALMLAAGCSLNAQAQTAIAIGGALKFDNEAVWSRIVQEAGGAGARFAVFATAAANPERSARQIIEALTRQGAVAEHIPVAPRLKGVDLQQQLGDAVLIGKVRGSAAVFFSGGAQELIVDTLQPQGRPTEMLKAIWSVYERGGVVAGTSAGAAIMSTVMFRDAQDALRVLKGALREGQEIDRGLGFVGPSLFIDQHFLKRGRIGRMLPLMQAKGYQLGLGVEENSAAVIKGGEIEVIGARGALLADLSGASHDPQLGAFNIRGVRLSFLDRGDRYLIASRSLRPAPQKARDLRIDPLAPGFRPYFKNRPYYADMLGDNTIVNAMAQLLDSAQPQALGLAFSGPPAADAAPADEPQADLGFEFRLYKDAHTHGWFTAAFGGEDYTVVDMLLDVRPVRLQRPLYRPIGAAAVPPATAPSTPSASGR